METKILTQAKAPSLDFYNKELYQSLMSRVENIDSMQSVNGVNE